MPSVPSYGQPDDQAKVRVAKFDLRRANAVCTFQAALVHLAVQSGHRPLHLDARAA